MSALSRAVVIVLVGWRSSLRRSGLRVVKEYERGVVYPIRPGATDSVVPDWP